jgi:hypothetical protein
MFLSLVVFSIYLIDALNVPLLIFEVNRIQTCISERLPKNTLISGSAFNWVYDLHPDPGAGGSQSWN